MGSVYERAFGPAPEDFERALELRAGRLPPDLRGRLLRAGPGARGPGSLPFLDGHGLLVDVAIEEGRARARGRRIDTPVLREEEARLGPRRRRLFTAPAGAARLDASAAAGTVHDALRWGGRTVTTDEHAHLALDEALAATGLAWRPEAGLPCPMPRIDAARSRLVAWSVRRRLGAEDRVVFHELDGRFAEASSTAPLALGAGCVPLHGHAFTGRWYVLPVPPAAAPLRAATAVPGPLWPGLRWSGRGRFALVPRGREGPAAWVEAPAESRLILHVANAFDARDRVVVDASAYRDVPPLHAIGAAPAGRAGPPSLFRYELDPATGAATARRIADTATDAACVDPRHLGRASRFVFGPTPALAGDEPVPSFYGCFHGVGRFDMEEGSVEAWEAGAARLCSPPAFAARPGGAEGEGWLLVWVLDGARDEALLVVLDATAPARGPVAELGLGLPLPAATHASFWPLA